MTPDRPPEDARRPGTVKIGYCDGPRLRRALLAAYEHLSHRRAELNRINVFPVADGDTGTNLALTLREVADAVRSLDTPSVGEVAAEAAEASVLGARGNSGILVSHMLLGFSRALGDRLRAGTREIAEAFAAAAESLSDALERPVEGTILTVARDTAEEAVRQAGSRADLYEWLREVRAAARSSLRRTRDMLPVLREAGVVDAGAKGFVSMLEGTLRYIEGRPLEVGRGASAPGGAGEAVPAAAGTGASGPEGNPARDEDEGRYCTQVSLRGAGLPDADALRETLAGVGTSLVVVRTADVARVHVHADEPDRVLERLAPLGTVESRQIEDTRAPRTARRVAVVTDSSADLPDRWAAERGVQVVPLQIVVGDRSYGDGVEIGPPELLEVLRDPDAPVPTTSQASPGAFLEAYRHGLEGGAEEVLAIVLSAAVSGTHGSAVTAARRLEEAEVRVVDSRTGSLGLGMMVIRAVELLEAGWPLEDVHEELERIRARSRIIFTVDDLEGLLRSGRVSRGRAWLGDLLGLRPLLTVDPEGRIVRCGRARSRDGALESMLERLDRELDGHDRYRLGVVHAGLPDFAGRVEARLRERYRAVETYREPLTAVIAAHAGAGAWGVCYQVED